MLTLDCISDAVLKPDVAGPIKAKGAMKHPDSVTPRVTIKSNLLIIESPLISLTLQFLKNKKKVQIKEYISTLSCNYFYKLNALFAIIDKFL